VFARHDVLAPHVLRSAGIAHTRRSYRRGDAIFAQGDVCDHVRFIESGAVKRSVRATSGKEA